MALLNALGEGPLTCAIMPTRLMRSKNVATPHPKRSSCCLKTFITPLDREEIHRLISNMDDVLDLMRDVAESVSLYDIKTVTPEAKQLGEICLQCCERVKSAVALVSNMDNATTILKFVRKLTASNRMPTA